MVPGFTNQMLGEMARLLEPLARETSPFAGGHVPRETQFVEPRLVCEVEYLQMTNAGKLRAPSYKGLRPDKAPEDCVLERPAT